MQKAAVVLESNFRNPDWLGLPDLGRGAIGTRSSGRESQERADRGARKDTAAFK